MEIGFDREAQTILPERVRGMIEYTSSCYWIDPWSEGIQNQYPVQEQIIAILMGWALGVMETGK